MMVQEAAPNEEYVCFSCLQVNFGPSFQCAMCNIPLCGGWDWLWDGQCLYFCAFLCGEGFCTSCILKNDGTRFTAVVPAG